MTIKILLFAVACALIGYGIYGSIFFVEDDLDEGKPSNQ